jgi:hypothetical protein
MRIVTTTALAVALVLASASASVSRTDNDRGIERCDAGLQRNVSVCNNMHSVMSSGWNTCIDTAIMMHSTCVQDAFRRMQSLSQD